MPQDDKVFKIGDLVKLRALDPEGAEVRPLPTEDTIGIIKEVDKGFYKKWASSSQDRITVYWLGGWKGWVSHEPSGYLEIVK